MWAFFERLLDSSMFAPHGICLLWEPELIWLHVASDVVIAAAYFSIPVALSIFVSKRRDVDFGWVFWAFALFIMACGVGHVMSIVTLWYPVYGIEGIVKAMTAAASIVTAAMLWPLLPKVLALPSPSQLRAAEVALAQEGVYRREAEDMLRQSQKMEAIGQLTGGVAHDFNNLLTIISGNLEIADRCLQSWSDAARERLTRVIANAANGAQRAAMLTQRLLAFARRQPLDPKLTNVGQLIAGMSDFFRRTLGENVELEVVEGAGLWQIEVDPSQLEAAILNLVVNAKDAMNARNAKSGRDGQQRQADDRDQQRFRRRGLSATERRRAGRAICTDRGERYRFRNAAGSPGEGVRSVLHHQATGAGHRPRIEPGLWLRQAIRRRDQDIQRGRARNDNQDLPAPRRRRCPRPSDRARRPWSAVRGARPSWWSRTNAM